MIEVSQLTKMYGPRPAITDLNFKIEKGEIVGFLGPNGAGKTTTMKILTGFMPATSGSAKVAGHDVFNETLEVKKNIGYLPETPPLYLEMIVQDYLEFAAQIHGVEGPQRKQAVSRVIEKVGLGEVKGRIIGNLSKGYRQRVGLAQALIHNPKVLILDEPTVGLDPKQIIEIRDLIKGVGADHTVILSTHILPEVTATCQRIIVIKKGKIVAQDTLEQLSARTRAGQIFHLKTKAVTSGGLEKIQAIQGVSSVKDSKQGYLVVEIDPKAGEVRDQITSMAVQENMGVLEFFQERASLEDVFLELTTEEELS